MILVDKGFLEKLLLCVKKDCPQESCKSIEGLHVERVVEEGPEWKNVVLACSNCGHEEKLGRGILLSLFFTK